MAAALGKFGCMRMVFCAFNIHAHREQNGDLSSLGRLRFDADLTITLLNDAIDRSQSEPRAASYGLGGEEWLKGVSASLLIHAHTGIANSDEDIVHFIAVP